MTSWDANPPFAVDANEGTTALWYRQMLIYAHELRALYAELRTSQGALVTANGHNRELADVNKRLRALLDEQFDGPLNVVKGYLELLENSDAKNFETDVLQLTHILHTLVTYIEQSLEGITADTPEILQTVLPAPRTVTPDAQLAMLQAQNLTLARDMRVLYDAERERSAELRTNNRRLNTLNSAGVRFGACKTVAELATIGLETVLDICEVYLVRLTILRRKVGRTDSLTYEDVEVVQVHGGDNSGDWLAGIQVALTQDLFNVMLPAADNYRIYVPIVSEDALVGLICVRGETSELLDAHSSLLTLAGLIGVTLDNIRLYADLNAKQATLNRFVSRLLSAQETERRRVAIDLHDGLAQTISSASHFFEAARHANPVLESDSNFKTGTQILRDATMEVRRLMADLRPSTLDELGLIPSLRGLVGQVAVEEGWMAEFETFGHLTDLNNAEVEDNLYRITQEALTNIKKHANASRILVRIQREDDTIHVAVRDWGQGMDVDAVAHAAQTSHDSAAHMGLVGIAERARLLNGHFSIDSKLGEGTLLRVALPLTKE